MERRSLIKRLFALPALAMTVPVRDVPTPTVPTPIHKEPIFLPIGCDLSFCSLQWAFAIAEDNKLGEVKYLLIGPENKYVARILLGDWRKPYSGDSEFNALYEKRLRWEVVRFGPLPEWTWKLVFERGVVVSEGPR